MKCHLKFLKLKCPFFYWVIHQLKCIHLAVAVRPSRRSLKKILQYNETFFLFFKCSSRNKCKLNFKKVKSEIQTDDNEKCSTFITVIWSHVSTHTSEIDRVLFWSGVRRLFRKTPPAALPNQRGNVKSDPSPGGTKCGRCESRWRSCAMTWMLDDDFARFLPRGAGATGDVIASSRLRNNLIGFPVFSRSPFVLASITRKQTQSYSIAFSNLKKNKSGQVEHRRWKFQIQSFSSNVTWEHAKEAIFWFLPVGGATKNTTTFICACLKRSIRTRTKKKKFQRATHSQSDV